MGLIVAIFGFLFILFRVAIGAALFLVRAHVAFAKHLFSRADDLGDALVKPQTRRQ